MKISVNVLGESFHVESESGAMYEIRYCGSGDADPEYMATWRCSCPGYTHRGSCKHMRAFLASRLPGENADLSIEEIKPLIVEENGGGQK